MTIASLSLWQSLGNRAILAILRPIKILRILTAYVSTYTNLNFWESLPLAPISRSTPQDHLPKLVVRRPGMYYDFRSVSWLCKFVQSTWRYHDSFPYTGAYWQNGMSMHVVECMTEHQDTNSFPNEFCSLIDLPRLIFSIIHATDYSIDRYSLCSVPVLNFPPGPKIRWPPKTLEHFDYQIASVWGLARYRLSPTRIPSLDCRKVLPAYGRIVRTLAEIGRQLLRDLHCFKRVERLYCEKPCFQTIQKSQTTRMEVLSSSRTRLLQLILRLD